MSDAGPLVKPDNPAGHSVIGWCTQSIDHGIHVVRWFWRQSCTTSDRSPHPKVGYLLYLYKRLSGSTCAPITRPAPYHNTTTTNLESHMNVLIRLLSLILGIAYTVGTYVQVQLYRCLKLLWGKMSYSWCRDHDTQDRGRMTDHLET